MLKALRIAYKMRRFRVTFKGKHFIMTYAESKYGAIDYVLSVHGDRAGLNREEMNAFPIPFKKQRHGTN